MTVLAALTFSVIVVATDDVGRLRAVGSVREAAQMLVTDWPAEKRGNAYRNACEVTYQALGGKGDVEGARQAFIFAATAAGIFVREGDDGDGHRAVGWLIDFPAPIASAPKRNEPPLLLWIPALSSWESGCWLEGSWRSWQNLDVTLTPSHWRPPPAPPAGTPASAAAPQGLRPRGEWAAVGYRG